jgi:hypothetical protein
LQLQLLITAVALLSLDSQASPVALPAARSIKSSCAVLSIAYLHAQVTAKKLCYVLRLQAAVLIHAAMNSGQGPLTGAELAAVTEGLKVLLLLSNRTAAQGEAAQVRCADCMSSVDLYL